MTFISQHMPSMIISLFALCAALLAAVITLSVKLHIMARRAERFFGPDGDRSDLEDMLEGCIARTMMVNEKYEDLLALIDNANERMRFCVQKVGVVRFNPFAGMGGDLSFALALLDEGDNGVVICTLHAREASYTYAKPIAAGESSYTLSVEEKRAIALARDPNRVVMEYREYVRE